MRFADARIQFTQHLKDVNRAPATIVAYNKDLEQLEEFLSNRSKTQVEEVDLDDLKAFQDSLLGNNYTPKSVSRKTNSIRTLFKYLKSSNLLGNDPASLLSHPRFELKPVRILTPLEYRALRDACRGDPRTAAVVEILLQTGIRISELADLTVDDVNLSGNDRPGELSVKGGDRYTQRRIPLNNAVQEGIQAWLKVRPQARTKNLFVTKMGKPLLVRNIRSQIDRYYKLAGVQNAKVNDLRHTFIAHQLKSGAPLHLVSKLAGHKRLSTTEKYLEYIEDRNETKVRLEEL